MSKFDFKNNPFTFVFYFKPLYLNNITKIVIMKKICLSVSIVFSLNYLNAQTLVNVPTIISQPSNISVNNFTSYVLESNANEGMAKITSFNMSNQTVTLSSTDFWPKGTWFHGYYERGAFWNPLPNSINCTHQTSGYTGCHPLVRINDKMIRAQIHTNHRYPNSFSTSQNIQKIKDGIDYMLDSQQNVPLDPVEDGGFTWWNFRPSLFVPNTNEDRNQNFTHAYETSHALRAMSEAYLYFKNYNIIYPRMNELYNAIIKAADNLYNKNPNDGQACDFSNNNFRGLGAWALAGAYKVTKDMKYFYGAKDICDIIMQQQNTGGGLADGMWLTGGTQGEDDGCGNAIQHDTRIYYHSMILRGLIETMDITPNTQQYLSWKTTLIAQIKKGVNHMINYRVSFYDNPPTSLQGQLRTTWLATNGGTTCAIWSYYNYEEVIEPIAMLMLYSNYQSYFSCDERKSLRNLLLVLGKDCHNHPTGYLENFVQYAYYADYLYAFDHNQRIYPQDENNVNVWYNTTVTPEIASKCPTQGSVTLTASSSSNYVWSNGLGSGNIKIVSPNVNTTYSVTGTDASGCSTIAQSVISMDNSLCVVVPPRGSTGRYGIVSTNSDVLEVYTIYPNPAKDEVIIECNEPNLSETFIEIYELLGNRVKKIKLNNEKTVIMLENLKQGTYFYKIISNNEIIKSDRIIIIR